MNKFILFGLMMAMVVCQTLGAETVEDTWYGKPEAACLSQGGLCIAQSECTQLIGREGELCPQQAAQGFQCCFGLPKNEKRCRMHGGQCFKKGFCSQRDVYSAANDCGDEQDCCILL